MTGFHAGRTVLWAVCAVVAVAIAQPAPAQTQEVQSRTVTNRASAQRAGADPLAGWKAEYAAALDAARQLRTSDSTRELGEQLDLDLRAYNEALEAYQRVSERLRHKDRAVTSSIGELKGTEGASSRAYQIISNAMQAGHEAAKNMISNVR